MIGGEIDDGDLVVVRKHSEAKEGQSVVAFIENVEYKKPAMVESNVIFGACLDK